MKSRLLFQKSQFSEINQLTAIQLQFDAKILT